VPPEGEFALINYRTTRGFKPPFRLHTTIEPDPMTDSKAMLTLRLWCEVGQLLQEGRVGGRGKGRESGEGTIGWRLHLLTQRIALP
jgi:hypothetical protein